MINARQFRDLMLRKVVLSESHRLILMRSITKSMLTLGFFLPPNFVDTGSLRRKRRLRTRPPGT